MRFLRTISPDNMAVRCLPACPPARRRRASARTRARARARASARTRARTRAHARTRARVLVRPPPAPSASERACAHARLGIMSDAVALRVGALLQEHTKQMQRFNVGEDSPVFDGLYNFCQASSGGSIGGAVKLNKGQSDVSINWCAPSVPPAVTRGKLTCPWPNSIGAPRQGGGAAPRQEVRGERLLLRERHRPRDPRATQTPSAGAPRGMPSSPYRPWRHVACPAHFRLPLCHVAGAVHRH